MHKYTFKESQFPIQSIGSCSLKKLVRLILLWVGKSVRKFTKPSNFR